MLATVKKNARLAPRFVRHASEVAKAVHFTDTPDHNSPFYAPVDHGRILNSTLANTTTLDVKVTQECNLNCPMCIDDKSSAVGINFDGIRDFLDQAKLFKRWQVRGIAIGGGEPLYRNKHKVLELVKYCAENGYYTTINTNGLLLKQADIDKYHKYLHMIHMPLDGATASVNNVIRTSPAVLKSTIRNIKRFNENGYEGLIKLATVATAKNAHDIPAMTKIFEEAKVNIDIWRLYQFRAHGMGKLAVNDLGLPTPKYNALVDQIRATGSPYVAHLAPNLVSQYIRKMFLLPEGDMSIGNNRLGYRFSDGIKFDDEAFFDEHGDHIAALERYVHSRVDTYDDVTGRVFKLPGVDLAAEAWHEYYDKRIRARGGYASYFEHKMSSQQPFLQYVLDLCKGSGKPVLEAGCGSAAMSCFLAKQGLEAHACDVDPRVLAIANEMAASVSTKVTIQRADIRATHMPRGRYVVSFNHSVMEHFDDAAIKLMIKEQTRIADTFVMCVPTAASGAKAADYFGDERYITVDAWDKIVEDSGCTIVGRFGHNKNGALDATDAPFVTYALREA